MTVPQMLETAWRQYSAGQFAAALEIYSRVLRIDGGNIAALMGTGFSHLNLGAQEPAVAAFRRLLALKPKFPPALAGMGEALNALGRPDETLAAFQTLAAVDGGSAVAFHGQGDAFLQMGRQAEARAAFGEAVKRAPNEVHHHFALAGAGRFVAGDARLAPLEALAELRLDPPAQCELQFALGKAYDDLGRPEEAFRQWQSANAIRRRDIAYDEAAERALMRQLAETFSGKMLAGRRGGGAPDQRPVFVVGMPRSGTSLVEQILASHSAVHGAGETMILFRLIGEGLLGPDFPACVARAAPQILRRFGAAYGERLAAVAPAAARVVDKMPANFLLVGLIHLALPDARIIHVRRDPLDTCLSCYAHLFTADIAYSYDLGELGRYYRGYEALMAHWRSVLPAGAMLEVRYEDLVADLEAGARRMIDYCGLVWEPACLSFDTNPRPVHTASALQVRQKIYATSVGRANAYSAWLEPLRRALAAD